MKEEEFVLFQYILKSAAVPSLLVQSDFVRDGTFEHFITKNYLALQIDFQVIQSRYVAIIHLFQNLNLKPSPICSNVITTIYFSKPQLLQKVELDLSLNISTIFMTNPHLPASGPSLS